MGFSVSLYKMDDSQGPRPCSKGIQGPWWEAPPSRGGGGLTVRRSAGSGRRWAHSGWWRRGPQPQPCLLTGRTGAHQGPRHLQRSGSRRYLRAGTRGLGQSDPGRVRERDRPLLTPAADGEVTDQPWRLRLRLRRVSGLASEALFPAFSHSPHPHC